MIYSFIQLRTMEDNVKKFLEESEKIVKQSFDEPLTPIKLEGENEIIEIKENVFQLTIIYTKVLENSIIKLLFTNNCICFTSFRRQII